MLAEAVEKIRSDDDLIISCLENGLVVTMFENNGFATAVINLFPSDFNEELNPVDFIEKNYKIIRKAMLSLSGS